MTRFTVVTLFPELFDSPLSVTLIGKGGKTARAIRTIVSAAAPRTGKRTLVEILE